MGNSTSSRAKATSATAEAAPGGKVSSITRKSFGARGRKVTSAPKKQNNKSRDVAPGLADEEPVLVSRGIDIATEENNGEDDVSTYETDEEFSDDDEDEEFDEFLAERMRILADAAALKHLANAFLHPELPVVATDPTGCGRCYFDRASAPDRLSCDEAEDQARILQDATMLKDRAAMYGHPEVGVTTTDSTATARCYYQRYSAPEQLSYEESEEQARILEDATKLRQAAMDYLHPEVGVTATDSTATARNFYQRASAPEQLSYEDAEEQARILQDAAMLKERAVMYAHPEIGVTTTDATATARSYFLRASAPEQLTYEESEERAKILADAKALKDRAVMYAHPELPVVSTDATATARSYFLRASAPEQESLEEMEERAQILADVKALKDRAVMYAHPELPITTTDATATARNFFGRASAPEQESLEEMEERAQILAETAALKKMAVLYAHPELPVEVSSIATARCYFDRASAPHDAEQIISTSAYCAEMEEEKQQKEKESLEQHMERLEALAPAATKVKTVPAAGPEAAAAIPRSASQVHLFDLQDAA